jgi:hypothetical protein
MDKRVKNSNRRIYIGLRAAVIICIAFIGWSAVVHANGEQPNILWITSEDNNVDWVGAYGNPHAYTPNIDQLAAEGFSVYALLRQCTGLRSAAQHLDYRYAGDFHRHLLNAESP